MKTNKYNYNKVIQQNYGQGYEDVSTYKTNSQGTTNDKKLLMHDLREYRLMGYPTRVIFRKSLNKSLVD
jgi:hypothetical protein